MINWRLIKLCILTTGLNTSVALAQDVDLASMQNVVAVLSGADPIIPGRQLADRQSESSRQLVRDYLKSIFTSPDVFIASHSYGTGVNIHGALASTTQSPETIVIGAHYDSVRGSPGANDNATGVAMVFGAVNALRQKQCRSKNIIFVFFDEEEKGLIGSREFAKMLKERGDSVHSVHTIDQIGWDQDGDRALELELPSPSLEQLYRQVAVANGYTMPLHKTRTSSTDHSSFRQAGFNAVGITEEYVNGDSTPHYHRASDTFETVDFGYLEDSTKFFRDLLLALTKCDEAQI